MVSPAGTALPPGLGQVVGAALSGGRERGGRGPALPHRPHYRWSNTRAGAAHCFPAGGWGASPAPSECPSGDATACPPAPSWMRPSAVSGRLGKASPAPGPPCPGGAWGAVAPRWPEAEGSRAAVSPRQRGVKSSVYLTKHLWNASRGQRQLAAQLGLGGCPGPGGGLPGGCCHRLALGVSGDSFRGPREELGMWGLPQGASSQPGPVEGAG